MAKKKTATTKDKDAERVAAPRKSAKADAPPTSRKATKKKAPAAKIGLAAKTGNRTLSNALIGETAGQVWHSLAEDNDQTLAALKKSIDSPDDFVLAAIGWLAREDKLAFYASGRSVKVSLR